MTLARFLKTAFVLLVLLVLTALTGTAVAQAAPVSANQMASAVAAQQTGPSSSSPSPQVPTPPPAPSSTLTATPSLDSGASAAPSPIPSSSAAPAPLSLIRSASLAGTSRFQCGAYTYGMSSTGTVYSVNATGVQSTVGSWRVTSASGSYPINALGVGENGSRAFALQRLSNTTLNVMQYNAATDAFTVSPTMQLPMGSGISGAIVAGAVDLETGSYLFGTYFKPSTGSVSFHLWSYTPGATSVKYVGNFPAPGVTAAANGDMAFDSAGNLYLIQSLDNQTVIYTITSANLKNSLDKGVPLKATQTFPRTIGLENVNGIAFNADGTVMLANQTTMQRFDPSTWTYLSTVPTSLPSSTDLASCASPPTFAVKKNVVGRYNSGDQFTLALAASGTSGSVAENTTTGSANGVQSEQVGPVPVFVGNTYQFSEKLSNGDVTQNYTSTWKCTQDGQDLVSGTGPQGSLTVGASGSATRGAAIECTFTNTPKQHTTLTLIKSFDLHYGAPAQPETWKLNATAINSSGQSGLVTTFSSGQSLNVDPGRYRIDEVSQPGYQLAGLTCRVADGPDVPLIVGGAQNQQFTVPEHQATTCTLVNRDLPGEIGWHKVDQNTQTALAGAIWRLDGPNGVSIDVSDLQSTNQSGSSGTSSRDVDPAAGSYRVKNLAWGHYTLTETQAPAGYKKIPGVAASFDIGPNQLAPAALTLRDQPLILALRKFGYPQQGQSQPSLIGGSQFAVFADRDGNPGDQVGTVHEDAPGQFTIAGLSSGDYWIQEQRSPQDHSLLAQAVPFQVAEDSTGKVSVKLTGAQSDLVKIASDGSTIEVYDQRSVTLPLAGGSGLTPFIYTGVGLTSLAVVLGLLLAGRRRALKFS